MDTNFMIGSASRLDTNVEKVVVVQAGWIRMLKRMDTNVMNYDC